MNVNTSLLKLNWSRPRSTQFPKIWKTFYAADISNSDELVEYRIQDLPESRFDDAVNHMISNYLQDEPFTSSLNGSNDEQHIADYTMGWRKILAQKTVLVCFKAYSEEIVGVNFNFVNSKEDDFFKNYVDSLSRDSDITNTVFNIISLPYENFDPFKHYGVNEYLGSFGLSVDRKYRGRGIGQQLLDARKAFCKEFGLKLTHTIFSSDFSNKNADKVGFKTDVELSFSEIIKAHPEWPIAKIASKALTIKTLLI